MRTRRVKEVTTIINYNIQLYSPTKLLSPESGFQGGPASDRIGILRGENRRKTSRGRLKNQQPT